MIPIDRQVQQTMGAFRGQPDKLMQRYKQGNDLIDLLALQQMKSDMDAVKQQMVLSQQQMPGTIKDQREQEVLAGYKEKAGRQVGDVAKNTAGLLAQRQASANANMQRQGIMQQPTKTASNGGLMQMAGGGIVGFAKGKQVISDEELKNLQITRDFWENRMTRDERLNVLKDLRNYNVPDINPKNLPYVGPIVELGEDIVTGIKKYLPGHGSGSDLVEWDEDKEEYVPKGETTKQEDPLYLGATQQKELKGKATGAPLPPEYEAPTKNELIKLQQERGEYTAPNMGLGAIKSPETNEKTNLGKPDASAADPKITAPKVAPYDPTNVENMTKPILEKYGLGNLPDESQVRSDRIKEIDTALNREGRLAQKRSQLARQEQLNKERLNPEELKRDALLKGLISAAGGGNFAAVGAGIFNEEEAQDLLKQQALEKSLGIENELMDIDLKIGEFGITQAGEAEKLLVDKQTAAAEIVSNFTQEELRTNLAEAKMELEANLGNVRTEMERLQIKSLDAYRKATTREAKRKVLSDMKIELLEIKEAARTADTKYAELQAAAEEESWFGGRDDEAIREFDEYVRAFEFKWIEKENTLGITDLEEEISLGDSGGSGNQGGYAIKRP